MHKHMTKFSGLDCHMYLLNPFLKLLKLKAIKFEIYIQYSNHIEDMDEWVWTNYVTRRFI